MIEAQGQGILKFEEENYLDLDQATCCTYLKPNLQTHSLGSAAAPVLTERGTPHPLPKYHFSRLHYSITPQTSSMSNLLHVESSI